MKINNPFGGALGSIFDRIMGLMGRAPYRQRGDMELNTIDLA